MDKVKTATALISFLMLAVLFIVSLFAEGKEQPLLSYNLPSQKITEKKTFSLEPSMDTVYVLDINQNNQINESNIHKLEEKELETSFDNELFYYTKNGAKYHMKEDCRYIINSSNIFFDKIIFLSSYQLTPCSLCGETASIIDSENKTEESTFVNPETEIYYYTKTGKKWHTDKQCRYLLKSKDIYEGSNEEIEAKALTPCSSCGK